MTQLSHDTRNDSTDTHVVEADMQPRRTRSGAGPLSIGLSLALKPFRLAGRGAGAVQHRVAALTRRSRQQPDSAAASQAAEQQLKSHTARQPPLRWGVSLPGGWSPFAPQSATGAAQRGDFPCQLCRHRLGFPPDCQDLVTTGSRQWGWLGSALKVKIYDFALYADAKQAKGSALARRHKHLRAQPADAQQAVAQPAQRPQQPPARTQEQQPQGQPQGAPPAQPFMDALRSSDDIEMSLMVRASRNLPLLLLSKEYERILKRRLKAVGGNPKDAALARMLDSFDAARLPPSLLQGTSVRAGTVMTFTRDGSGVITAHANDTELVSVQSRALCHAVFDLYLGHQCVSKPARDTAGQSVISMMGDAYFSPSERGLCNASTQACNFARS